MFLPLILTLFLQSLGAEPQAPPGQAASPNSVPGSVVPPCVEGDLLPLVAACPRTVREYLGGPSWMPSESAIAELDAATPMIESLSAVISRDCEWTMDWYGTLPAVAPLRTVASILDADSRRLERFGRRDESAARIVAMFGLARVLARIPRLDAQREASRLSWQAAQRAGQFFVAPPGAKPAAQVRAAVDAFLMQQDESLAKVVSTERIRWVSRPVDRIRLGQDGAALYQAAALESAADVTKSNEYPLSRLSGEPLMAEMRLAEAYFDAAALAWAAPDASAQLAALARRAERAELGAWVAAARPSFVRVRSDLDRTRSALRSLRDVARAAERPGAPSSEGDEVGPPFAQ